MLCTLEYLLVMKYDDTLASLPCMVAKPADKP